MAFGLPPLYTELKVDIDGFKSEMDKAGHYAVVRAREVGDRFDGVAKAGGALKSVGSAATKYVTVPLVAAGTASVKMATDFSKSMGNVKTLFDGTGAEIAAKTKEMGDTVKRLSKEINIDLNDMANGAYNVVSAFGDTPEAAKQLEAVAKAAKAGGAQTTDALNLLSAVTKGYGDTSYEAMMKASDLAFMTVKLGQTDFPELAGSIGRVVPIANSLKVSQEELFGVMATATGVTGSAAEVSTQFRGILQALMSPTKDMSNLLNNLGYANGEAMIQGMGLNGVLRAIKKAADDAGLPLQKFIGSIEGQTLALALTGELQDVWVEKTKKMGEVAGSTEEAFKRVSEEQGEKMAKALNKIKVSMIEAGEKLLPIAVKAAEKIADLADKFSKLSPEQQKSILKMGAFAVAAGPVLKVVGGLLQTVPKVASGFSLFSSGLKAGLPLLGKFSGGVSALPSVLGQATSAAAGAAGAGGIGGFGASLLTAAGAAAPFIAAVAGIGAVGYVAYKELNKKVIPEVDLFEAKITTSTDAVNQSMYGMAASAKTSVVYISEATKEAVGAYMALDEELTRRLIALGINQETVSEEIKKSMVSKVEEMSAMILKAENEQYSEREKLLQDYFTNTSSMSEKEKQSILERLQSQHEEEQSKTKENAEEIKKIIEQASKEKRKLTEAERAKIKELQEAMRQDAVTTLSATEEEAVVIRERLKSKMEQITAEEASSILKKAIEVHDKEIETAEDKYETLIKEAYRMKEAGIITEEQYKKMVEDAEKARDKQIEAADKGLEGIKTSIENAFPGIASKIDMITGEIKSKWQSAWESVKSWWNKIWNLSENTPTPSVSFANESQYSYQRKGSSSGRYPGRRPHSHYSGLNYVPYDGYMARLHKGERVLTARENSTYEDKIIQVNYPVDTGRLDRMIALLKSIADKELTANIDGKEASRLLAPHMSRELSLEVMR